MERADLRIASIQKYILTKYILIRWESASSINMMAILLAIPGKAGFRSGDCRTAGAVGTPGQPNGGLLLGLLSLLLCSMNEELLGTADFLEAARGPILPYP